MRLSPDELERYQWQIGTEGFGIPGQERLRSAHVFISRVGGVGGTVALLLAAAGIGKLTLAHGGLLRRNDLNRQLLMTAAGIGRPRLAAAAETLRRFNPEVDLELIGENVSDDNRERCMAGVDLVVSASPLIEERLSMNRQAIAQRVPLVDCAMYDFEVRLLSVLPGRSACLACLFPEAPPHWKRQFPVFGAIASTVGGLAATEVIKLLCGMPQPLTDRLLVADLRQMRFTTLALTRSPGCPACGGMGGIGRP